MSTHDPGSSVARSCGRGRWRVAASSLLVALLAPLLALAMVATTSAPAQAFQPKPKKPTISPFTRGVPGSVMRASPFGRAVNVVYAGLALYQVGHSLIGMNDSNPAQTGSQNGLAQQGTAQCQHVVMAISRTGDHNQSAVVTIGSQGTQGAQSGNCDSYSLTLPTTRTCSTGGVANTVTSNVQWNDNPAGSATKTIDLCGGGTLIQIAIDSPVGGPTEGEKFAGMQKDFPIPDETYLGRVTVHCTRTNGTGFTISTTDKGAPMEIQVPSCYVTDPASWADSMKVEGGPEGGVLRDQGTTTPRSDVLQQYPNCFDALGGMICTIRVWIAGDPCVVGDSLCLDWQHTADLHPEMVKCKWGSYVVPLSDCSPLKHVYATGTAPVTGTDPDGNPTTDPATGTGTGTSTGFPGSGKNWDPLLPESETNVKPPVVDPTTDPDTPSCWGQGWSWNPVSWVYVPVKCAMLWAFVPDNAPSFSDVPSPLPGGWLPSLPSMSSACGPVTMPRLSLGFNGMHVGPTQLFSTCADPWPMVRTFTYNGQLVLVLVAVVWQSFRAVTSGVGMGVQTGGGSDDE